ncbi:hemolysin III family protein [Paenibacillus alba]|uniref:PAQR family membrane homeostasis protein TrhA n=1 Tax=Paenibacillus alba TaxID=1197127 RepID=UPI001565B496|nr:hemolysin III family protein [Paenibacillus alba]NQX70279.1 hemolysin III family protein [Paenibacillus alba]
METGLHLREERLNAISHGIGVILSVMGLVLLLQRAAMFQDWTYTISNFIYGTSYCLVYLSSTLLHSSRSRKWSERFEKLDHASIFIAIAGSYTPFLLITLPGFTGYTLLVVIWALALAGVRYVSFIIKRFMPWGLIFYMVMGGFMMSLILPLYHRLPMIAVIWIVLGVIAYLVGLMFFLWRNLKYHHTIWHLFVLAGSSCHFIAVYGYVMPSLL